MRSSSFVLIVLGVSVASIAIVVACTSASTVGENPPIVVDAATDDRESPPPSSGDADARGGTSPLDAATDGACWRSGGSGSSGSNGSCDYSEEWTCDGETIALRCTCPEGTCACGSDTFAHDCSNRCFMTASERKRCRVPPLPSSGGSSSGSDGSIDSSAGD